MFKHLTINTIKDLLTVYTWCNIFAQTTLLFKGEVSDFWKPMLIFEITKTNTPLHQKGPAPIFAPSSAPHSSLCNPGTISSVKLKKKQWYTVYTPDASGAPKYYRSPDRSTIGVLLLALYFADVFLFSFYPPSLSFCHSAVHWPLSPPHE